MEQAEELEQRSKELSAQEKQMRRELQLNNTRIESLARRYDDIVRSFDVPWYSVGDIDPSTYLPRLESKPFDRVGVGGARKTLVNLAYLLANLSGSIEDYAVLLPTLLIVDSPRKNVGENEDDRAVADAIYAQFRLMPDAMIRPFQLIVADNHIPLSANRWLTHRIELTYDSP